MQEKKYSDDMRNTKTFDSVQTGDKVFVRNSHKDTKLLTNYESEPYMVKAKEGSEVVITSDEGVEKRRNYSFVKPYVKDIMPDAIKVADEPMREVTISSPRPSRVRSTPAKFKDFVLG